jgi:hypothetical protein
VRQYAPKPQGNQPLTQEHQGTGLLRLIWGCDERMLPKMDASSMCDAKGIRRADIRAMVADALNSRRASVAAALRERMA